MPADPENPDQAEAVTLAEGMAGLGTVFEALIYIFGIYTVVMAFFAGCCCSKNLPEDAKCFSCSGCQGSCIMVTLFQLFQLVLLGFTIGIAIMPFAFYMIPNEDVTTFCSDYASMQEEFATNADGAWYVAFLDRANDYVTLADTTINIRSDIMCTDACCCDLQGTTVAAGWGEDFNTEGRCFDGAIKNWSECEASLNDEAEAEAADDRSTWTDPRGSLETYLDGVLKVLEDEFNCQGICSSGDFYLFKDVNEGKPESGCLPTLKADFSSASFAAMIVLFCVAAVDLLIFICMFGMYKRNTKA